MRDDRLFNTLTKVKPDDPFASFHGECPGHPFPHAEARFAYRRFFPNGTQYHQASHGRAIVVPPDLRNRLVHHYYSYTDHGPHDLDADYDTIHRVPLTTNFIGLGSVLLPSYRVW